MKLRDLLDDHIRASRGFWRVVAWSTLLLGIAMIVSAAVIAILEVIAWSKGTSIWSGGRTRRSKSPMAAAIILLLLGIAFFRIGRDEFDGLDEYTPPHGAE